MNKQLIILLQVCLLLGTSCTTVEEKSVVDEKSVEEKPVEDSLLLSLVLKWSYEESRVGVIAPLTSLDHSVINESTKVENTKKYLFENIKQEGGYTIVAPYTSLSRFVISDPKRVEQTKKYILDNISIEKYEIRELVDLLFERNKTPVPLALKSSQKNGYLIDYDGKFEKYFEKDGGGWEKFYKENPKADGRTTVSLPAYDRKTGILLVYIGTQRHYRSGSGRVIAYKYEQGQLKELARIELWVS